MENSSLTVRQNQQSQKNIEDEAELIFSINQLHFLIQKNQYRNLTKILQQTDNIIKSKVLIKIKFYTLNDNIKLIQKVIKVKLKQIDSQQTNTMKLIFANLDINLKVTFPKAQQSQIVGKVYILKKKIQSNKFSQKLIAYFKINLSEEFMYKNNKQSEGISQNPQNSVLQRQVKIHLQGLMRQDKYQKEIKQYKVVKREFGIQDKKFDIFQESFIFFKLSCPKNLVGIEKTNNEKQQHKRLSYFQKLQVKRNIKNLNIQKYPNLKVEYSAEYDNNQNDDLDSHQKSTIKITLIDKQKRINRAKSQTHQSMRYEDIKILDNSNKNEALASKINNSLTFQQKIYQLLTQVKNLRKFNQCKQQEIKNKLLQNVITKQSFRSADKQGQKLKNKYELGKMITSITINSPQDNTYQSKIVKRRHKKNAQIQRIQNRLNSYQNIQRLSKKNIVETQNKYLGSYEVKKIRKSSG